MISLRFSKPLRVETVNDRTVSLSGPKGIEAITIVTAENGSLAFLTSTESLLSGTTYTVSINGAIDHDGLLLPVSGTTFSTKAEASAAPKSSTANGLKQAPELPTALAEPGDDDFVWKGRLKNGKPHVDWEDLLPLKAKPGITALAGQVLDLKGQPLARVVLMIEDEYGSIARALRQTKPAVS